VLTRLASIPGRGELDEPLPIAGSLWCSASPVGRYLVTSLKSLGAVAIPTRSAELVEIRPIEPKSSLFRDLFRTTSDDAPKHLVSYSSWRSESPVTSSTRAKSSGECSNPRAPFALMSGTHACAPKYTALVPLRLGRHSCEQLRRASRRRTNRETRRADVCNPPIQFPKNGHPRLVRFFDSCDPPKRSALAEDDSFHDETSTEADPSSSTHLFGS